MSDDTHKKGVNRGAKEIRDLLVECFCDAHCKALEESAERKLTEQEKNRDNKDNKKCV